VIEMLISRFNFVVLNTSGPTHVSLASGNLSYLDLGMCSPAISAHFTWRLLDDLCMSDPFLICLRSQVSSRKSEIETGL
jgi:hypothetical protein